jgi:DNA polymerase-3 subunit gamma/tau
MLAVSFCQHFFCPNLLTLRDIPFLMDNFIVSARKYRPATFDTVVGQAPITTTLKNAIKNKHLAQAFLFCGPRGVGKTTCARILAKTINCFHITEATEACDKCESCTTFNNGNSMNIYELDAASNNTVDDIRGLVEKVRIAPQVGNKKIYIIDEVHMLSTSAFNAFLKTLEEPPPYAIFILATTEKHKILPTILSRCQIFDFSRIQVDDIAKHLAHVAAMENIEADPDALHIIAQKADGALRDSLSMFDQIVSFAGNKITYKAVIDNLNILDYDYYFKAADALLVSDIPSSLLLFNEILNHGFDGSNFINGLGAHCRDLLVCKDKATVQLLEVNESIRTRYLEQAVKASVPFLLSALSKINQCDVQYKMAKNHRLHVELTLLALCSINNPVKMQANAASEASIQKKTKDRTIESKVIATPVKPKEAPLTTQATTPPTAPLTMPLPSKGISISSILSPKEPAVAPESQSKPSALPENPLPTAVSRNNKDFDKEKLMTVWNRYAQKHKEDSNMNLYSTLTKREPFLSADFTIELMIDNKVQEDAMNGDKMNFLGYLRKELENADIQLKLILNVIDEPAMVAYTSADKFKRMTEINPLLATLKEKLDLELDF